MERKRPDNSILCAKLRKLREEAKLSVNVLGQAIGRHGSRVSKWENGEGFPTHGDLLAYAKHFGVDLEWLCDDAVPSIEAPREEIPPPPSKPPRTRRGPRLAGPKRGTGP